MSGANRNSNRGRGGRAAPRQQRDDDSDDDVPKQIVPARGAGGRGRQPDTESDEDDEDYDDDEDDDDYDGGDDDEDEEQIADLPAGDLALHQAVMRRVVTAPESLAADNAAELVKTLDYFYHSDAQTPPNVRAPNAYAWFSTAEGFGTLLALVRATSGEAPLAGLEVGVELGSHALKTLSAFSLSRKALDVFVEHNLLPSLYALFAKYTNEPRIMDEALEVLDNILQISQQNQQVAGMLQANLVGASGDEQTSEPLNVGALMGPDMRRPVLELGFVEWAAANLNSLSEQSANLALNLMYAMVEREDNADGYSDDGASEDEEDASFDPRPRFLKAGGIAALDQLVSAEVAKLAADDESFCVARALLGLRLGSNLVLNDASMAAAVGESGLLAAAETVLAQVREKNFDADEPIDEELEQLVMVTLEFVSMFIDLLANRDRVLAGDCVDHVLNFLEHAALGETKLEVSSEFRTTALQVLVSGLDVEGQLPAAQRTFAQYLLEHEAGVETVLELLEQGANPDEDDDEAMYLAEERMQNEAPTLIDILTNLASSRAGAEALVKKGVDKKMYGLFDAAKAAAEGAEEPEEQDAAFDRMEKALAVLTPLAVVPQVQKMLYDKKCEPVFRRLITDEEGSEYVRVELLGLLANLVEHDKWATAINARQKEFVDTPARLMAHHLLEVRSGAVNYLAAAAKVPVLAAAIANKGAALAKVCALAQGVDDHEARPQDEDDEDDDEDDEDGDDTASHGSDGESTDDEDVEEMAQNAMSALVNLARSSSAAPKLCEEAAFRAALTRAIDREQPDTTLRVLAALVIGQLTLVDKERAFVPAPLLAALESLVPDSLELPVAGGDDANDDASNGDLVLDSSLQWDAADDIYPLLASNHRGTRRLGAYLTALIVTHAQDYSHVAAPSPAVRERLAAIAADEAADSLAARFATLTVQKL